MTAYDEMSAQVEALHGLLKAGVDAHGTMSLLRRLLVAVHAVVDEHDEELNEKMKAPR
jgi:hypothetical protein